MYQVGVKHAWIPSLSTRFLGVEGIRVSMISICCSQVGWKRVDWAEFFRLSPSQLSSGADAAQAGAENSRFAQEVHEVAKSKDSSAAPVVPAAFVQPLYISKVNTVFQLCLIAGCIGNSWYGFPPEDMLWILGGITGVTTLGSFAAYIRVYRQGKLLSR